MNDNIEDIDNDNDDNNIEVVTDDQPKKAIPADEGIEEFRRQLAAERERREAAERRANEAESAHNRSQSEVYENNLLLINTGIENAKRESEILTDRYSQALRDQDFETAAKIQSEMVRNATQLVSLEQGKQTLEANKDQYTRQQPSDPVEALASQLSPRAAAWVRAHPEYARDQNKYRKMVAAHNLVEGEVELDSDEYFNRIEGILGIKAQQDDSPLSAAAAPAARKPQPSPVPVSRGDSSNRREMRLTPDEIEMAEMMGMTKEDYAKHKAALVKEGRMN